MRKIFSLEQLGWPIFFLQARGILSFVGVCMWGWGLSFFSLSSNLATLYHLSISYSTINHD